MKPEWCSDELWKEALGVAAGYHTAVTGSVLRHSTPELAAFIARALIEAHKRGREEGRAEGMREGMKENQSLRQIISECAEASGAFVSPSATLDFMAMLPKEIAAIRAKAQEVKT